MTIHSIYNDGACPKQNGSCLLLETSEDIAPEILRAVLREKKHILFDLNLDSLRPDKTPHQDYQSWCEKNEGSIHTVSITSAEKIFDTLKRFSGVLNEPEFVHHENVKRHIRVGHKRFGTISFDKFHISNDQKFEALYTTLCKRSEIAHSNKANHHSKDFNIGFPRLYSFVPSQEAKNGNLRDIDVIPSTSLHRSEDVSAMLIGILNLRYKKDGRDNLREEILSNKYTHCILSPSVPKYRNPGWQKWDSIKWVGLLDHKVFSTNMPLAILKEEPPFQKKPSAHKKISEAVTYIF